MEEIGIVRYYLYKDGESLRWVQSTADMAPDVKLHWRQREVVLTPAPEGTTDIAGDEEFAVLQRSVDRWMALSCEGPSITVGATEAANRARFDSTNRVIYRHDSWDNQFRCDKMETISYDPNAIALTTLCYGTKSGEIYDADIEINAIGQPLGVCAQDSAECATDDPDTLSVYDLEGVLTHELGHFIGLDHTCWTPKPGMTQPPFDDLGNPVPLCAGVTDPEILDATMYPKAAANDVSLRSLEPDDVDGFCGIYAGNDWRDDGGCGCRTGGAASDHAGLPVLIGALGVLAVLKRRR
jgi:MYXO-CTERM domain-containing protein